MNNIEVLDLKFVNNGDGTAFITCVEVEILKVTVDDSPSLKLHYSVENGIIVVYVRNVGWGHAILDYANLSNSSGDICLDKTMAANLVVKSGEVARILEIVPSKSEQELKTRLERRKDFVAQIPTNLESKEKHILSCIEFRAYLSRREQWHIEEFFKDLENARGFEGRLKWHIDYFRKLDSWGLPVDGSIKVTLAYSDERGNYQSKDLIAKHHHNSGGELWWTDRGFLFKPEQVLYQLAPVRDVHLILLNPDLGNVKRRYKLSNYLRSGDVERLHFLFATEKSANYEVQFVFYFNKRKWLKSERISLFLQSENRPDFFYDNIKDGKHLIFRDGRLTM